MKRVNSAYAYLYSIITIHCAEERHGLTELFCCPSSPLIDKEQAEHGCPETLWCWGMLSNPFHCFFSSTLTLWQCYAKRICRMLCGAALLLSALLSTSVCFGRGLASGTDYR